MPQRKETEMKEHNGPSIICAVLLFGAVLVSTAFADMKKVDERELARANASVTGASVKDPVVGVAKVEVNPPDSLQVSDTLNKDAVFPTPSVSKTMDSIGLNINGQPTFQFYYGGSSSTTGGITSVKTH
jgi:hypothetical protein